MTKISIRGEEYTVSFARRFEDIWVDGHGVKRVMTTYCYISKGGTQVAVGKVRLNVADQDIKKVGYKHALTRALQTWRMTGTCGKALRREVWQQMTGLFS